MEVFRISRTALKLNPTWIGKVSNTCRQRGWGAGCRCVSWPFQLTAAKARSECVWRLCMFHANLSALGRSFSLARFRSRREAIEKRDDLSPSKSSTAPS